jgi:hypothetical protein
LNEFVVEGGELFAVMAQGKVQGVGEIKAGLMPFDCFVDKIGISDMQIRMRSKGSL